MAELDRRDFLKLVGLCAGGAAAAGCSDHVEKLIPYVVQPEEITPGSAVDYASTCLECPAACGLHVRTREGRPIKLEGNPEHPVNRGCALRARPGEHRPHLSSRPHSPPAAAPRRRRRAPGRQLGGGTAAARGEDAPSGPAGTWVLGGTAGPTLSELIDRFVAAVGGGGRLVYEPLSHDALREASRAVFGAAGLPIFDLEGADFVIDFEQPRSRAGSRRSSTPARSRRRRAR